MIETVRWRILLVALPGWVNRRQLDVIDYWWEENRILEERLHPPSVRDSLRLLGPTYWAGCARRPAG